MDWKRLMRVPVVSAGLRLLAAGWLLGLGGMASAQEPGYSPAAAIPRPLAEAIVRGNTRMVVVGDSISVNTFGEPSGGNHSPIVVGMHRVWEPGQWRGIFAPIAPAIPGGYNTARGVGGSMYEQADGLESLLPMSTGAVWPGGVVGFGTEISVLTEFVNPSAVVWFAPRFNMRLFSRSTTTGSRASASLLARENLRMRTFVFTNPAVRTPSSLRVRLANVANQELALVGPLPIANTRLGWGTVDFGLGQALQGTGFNPASGALLCDVIVPPEPGAATSLATMGVLFDDPTAAGLQVHSVAAGGWRTVDHLSGGFEGRGYSDLGLIENLRAFGFADPGVTPVVMITLGTNRAPGEVGSEVTPLFASNVQLVMNRYRSALAQMGAAEPYFFLVGMYSWTFPPDLFTKTRNDALYELARATPRTGFINLWTLMGSRGDGFTSAWFQYQVEGRTTGAYTVGGNALTVQTAAPFSSFGGSVFINGGPGAMGFASFTGTAQGRLTGFSASFNIPVGAKVLTTEGDLHLSLVGSEKAASLMWTEILRAARKCNGDYDLDGDVGTDADIEAFFACLAGNCCARCVDADFNGDGDAGTDADIEAFFRVLAGGAC